MGSQVQEEFTVLVTGFQVCVAVATSPHFDVPDGANCATLQPFRAEYPINPSWEIARSLPEYLPALRAKDPSSRYAVNTPPVRILVHPEPIRVSYKTVRELVPSLWEETYAGRKIDLVIHIGMAGPRPMYQIESRGHRTGYKSPDVDGRHLDSLEGERGEDWIWHGLPDTLRTDLDMQDIWERWQQHSSVRLFVIRLLDKNMWPHHHYQALTQHLTYELD